MKKSLIVISCLIVAVSVALTSCGKKNVFTDENGNTHVVVTDKHGNYKQNQLGHAIEIVTDAEGKTTRTQVVRFPAVKTNKSQSKIENAVVKINVPKDWSTSGLTNKLSLQHTGECTKTGSPHCEINVTYDVMLSLDDMYRDRIGNVKWLVEYSGECSDLREYELDLFGDKAKCFSYKFDKTGITCYYYYVQKEIPTVEFEIYTYKDCYTEEQIIQLLTECCTIKELGGEKPSTTAASSTTAVSAEASTEATSAAK